MAEMEEAFTSVSDGIGELVLNRPERKNALSPTLVAALSAGAQCSAACSGCSSSHWPRRARQGWTS